MSDVVRVRRVVAVAAVATVALTGALAVSDPAAATAHRTGPTYNAAANRVVNTSTKAGGTLRLLASGDCDSWDPARTYYGWCWNMQRLFTRTLVGYSKVNGTQFRLAPDLATSKGRHNSSYTRWSYTLKRGLKFSTGKPITPRDIKWGIERLFATDVVNGGPSSYFVDTIAHPRGYAGPYRDGDLHSIRTTKRTITFRLSRPYADFDRVMALPAAAPVPYRVEGGPRHRAGRYWTRPVASGPFKIKSYRPNRQIVFVRNPYWHQSTDSIRHPLVNRVDLVIDVNPDDIDQRLQSGRADARADNGVSPTFEYRILSSPRLKRHADDPVSTLVRYMAVMPSVIPNLHCRRAIFYAFDKFGARQSLGGASAGSIAHSMTPPGIPGYQPKYKPYPSGARNRGNLAAARRQLKLCGKPSGFNVRFAYSTPSTSGPILFRVEKKALARVGIRLTAITSDQSNYYSTFIGSPRNIKRQHIGMAIAGWGPDFPTGLGFYNSIVNGRNITPTGNTNYASLNNRTVNRVLRNAAAGKAGVKAWRTLDHAVMNSAVYLPYVDGRTLYYRNPRMTNVTCNNALAFGIYDFVNIGVR